jgi:hypothetical protein
VGRGLTASYGRGDGSVIFFEIRIFIMKYLKKRSFKLRTIFSLFRPSKVDHVLIGCVSTYKITTTVL